MTSLAADMRIAFRTFARRPGFTAVVVLTTALGVGATTAIFSAAYPILFATLPYPNPDRVVAIKQVADGDDGSRLGYATIVDRLAQTLADRGKRGGVLVVETYPGVDDAELLSALRRGLRPARVVDALDLRLPESQVLA